MVDEFGGKVVQYDVVPGGALSPKANPTIAAGREPYGVAVSQDGRSVYVANHKSDSVSEYDVRANGELAPKRRPAVAAGRGPCEVAVSPDGRSVYVVNEASRDVSQYDVGPGGQLAPKAPATIAAGVHPVGLAVSPDSRSVYVTNFYGDDVSQYDAGPGGALAPKASATIAAGGSPLGVAVSPDGKSVYVANKNGGTLSQYDIGPGGALARKASALVTLMGPYAVVVSPDGRSVYVTDYDGNAIAQYDIGPGGALAPKARPTDPAFGTRSAPGGNPGAMAVSPDGRSLYAVYSAGVLRYGIGARGLLGPTVSAVTVGLDTYPFAVAVSPDQGPLRCVVPPLGGMTPAGAGRALRRSHCTLGTLRRRHRAPHGRRGRVIAQRPAPGSVLALGAPVTITLNGAGASLANATVLPADLTVGVGARVT